jgi:hypothetical protein
MIPSGARSVREQPKFIASEALRDIEKGVPRTGVS